MLVRGRTWYLYILVYLVGYRPTAVCAVYIYIWMGGLIRQGPCHDVTCPIRIGWSIYIVSVVTQVRQQCHFVVLAGEFDGTEKTLHPSNAPHGVREVHAPHVWGRCQAHATLTSPLGYTAGQSTRHQIITGKLVQPGYLVREWVRCTLISVRRLPNYLFSCKSQPAFLVTHFLISRQYPNIIYVIQCILPVHT